MSFLALKNHIKKFIFIGIPLLLVVYLFIEFRISDDQWKQIISSDGRGYYHYLVEYFVPKAQQYTKNDQTFLVEKNGRYYTKYSAGTAILLSPFFLAAFAWAQLAGYELTGYSYPFQLMVGIGGLTYLLIGATALFQLLRTYRFSSIVSGITVLTVVFGTNLLIYGILMGSMSHVYSFAAVTGFALFLRKSFLSFKSRYLLAMMVCFGLLFLVRPFNALVVLAIPILVADLPDLKNRIKILLTHRSALIIGSLVILALVGLQIISWRHQSGEWILFSYPHEGFYLTKPKVLKVLFSFNKGLFIYTPLVILCLIGARYWFHKSRKFALFFFGFFGVITYFISAWWCWNYASGFGLRAFIDFYGIFAIPLAFLVNQKKSVLRLFLTRTVILFIGVNLVQSFQYSKLIMHHSSMNFEKYRYIFLRTSDAYSEVLGGNYDVAPYSKHGHRLLHVYQPLTPDETLIIEDEFALSTTISAKDLPASGEQLHLKISFEKKDRQINSSEGVLFVAHITSKNDSTTHYSTFKINDIPDKPVDKWFTLDHSLNIPCPGAHEQLKLYFWNRKSGRFEIRNYRTEIYS